jgi:hypothetical protein
MGSHARIFIYLEQPGLQICVKKKVEPKELETVLAEADLMLDRLQRFDYCALNATEGDVGGLLPKL